MRVTVQKLESERFMQDKWKLEDVRVAFICAVKDEYDAFLAYLEHNGIKTRKANKIEGGIGARRFLLPSDKGGIPCIVVRQLQAGMTAACFVCGRILERCKPELVAMPGICGGVEGKVNRGDLVVAEMTFDYCAGKFNNKGKFQAQTRQRDMCASVTNCVLGAEHHLKEILATCDPAVFRMQLPGGSPILVDLDSIDLVQGPLGTGGSVVNYAPIINRLKPIQRDMVAYDMEAYAVAYMCDSYYDKTPTPWLVVKGVQDLPSTDDAQKGMYTKAAAQSSVAFAMDVAKRYIQEN